MVRPLSVEYPGAYYYAINRGNNQEKILKKKARVIIPRAFFFCLKCSNYLIKM